MRNSVIRLPKMAWFALLIAVLAVFGGIFAMLESERKATEIEIAQAKQQTAALSQEYSDLQEELDFIKSDEGLELYARAYGMQMPDEIRYVPSN